MAKRMMLMLAAVAVLLTGLGFLKFRQIQSAVQAGVFQPPPEAVTTIIAKREAWPATTSVIGTVEAVQGVTLSADLPGTVSRITFDSGKWVEKGEVLVELDTREEHAQLAEAEAQRDLTHLNFARSEDLLKGGVISRQDYDRSTADQKQAEGKVEEIRATIERKTIRAPFSGILGLRKVNLGQYLSAGTPIASLQSLNPVYVNFGVPQQLTGHVQVGRELRITKDDMAGQIFAGRVTALDSVVDPSTRNIQVQATVPNAAGKLRPGMFVQVEAVVGASHDVIAIPASAINYAPYGDSVFIVTDLKDPKGQAYRGVRQQFVKLEGGRGDQVAVISGVNPGDEVVTSGVFKLRNGAAVQVNNKVQPSNNPAPNPADS